MPLPSEIILNKFQFSPTLGQQRLFSGLDEFLDCKAPRPVMIIRGYAGTGKTTVVSALVKTLPLFNYKYSLLAPTGRAAKVMSAYAKKMAFTIHKRIYKLIIDTDTGNAQFRRQKNYSKKAVFVVDEASMLAESAEFGTGSLLKDLLDFVFEQPDNKLILVGDVAQLPPVGQLTSLALDKSYLERHYQCQVFQHELREVMRQEATSGILENATSLRELLPQEKATIRLRTKAYPDIFKMGSQRLEEGLRYAYEKYGEQNTILVCRSNKAANLYNQLIRREIRFCQDELEAGDLLMVVRNNYVQVPDQIPGGFVANGDFAEVMKIVSFEEMYGFRFADLQLRMVDYPNHDYFQAKVLLNTLSSPATALPKDDLQQLYRLVSEDYQDLEDRKEQKEALRKDPYLNALQIKFAYALTCHKAQGGQWDAVFVDQGYLKEEMVNKEYIRWLYTAVTRATKELFLINFKANFFY